MIKAETFNFYGNCHLTQITLQDKVFLIGSIFTENSFCEYTVNDIETFCKTNFKHWLFWEDEAKSEAKIAANETESKLISILSNANYIIVNTIEDLICWPYILKKYGQLTFEKFSFFSSEGERKQLQIITTEPISQIGCFYLKTFYNSFNNCIKTKLGTYYVTEEFIASFMDLVIKLNYNQRIVINETITLLTLSSGYNLGSFNFMLNLYSKSILVLTQSSILNKRYTQEVVFPYDENVECVIVTKGAISSAEGTSSNDIFYTKLTALINMINQSNNDNGQFCDFIFASNFMLLLDLVDYFRARLSKTIKIVHLNAFIKYLIEYSNISHGFLNPTIHSKIYDFVFPFNFDELLGIQSVGTLNEGGNKGYNSFYNSHNQLIGASKPIQRLFITKGLDDVAQQEMLKKDSSILFMINTFSLGYEEETEIYVKSILNFHNGNKKLVISQGRINTFIKEISESNQPNGVKFISNLQFDPRLTNHELTEALSKFIGLRHMFDLNHYSEYSATLSNLVHNNCLIKLFNNSDLDKGECTISESIGYFHERNQVQFIISDINQQNGNKNEIEKFESSLSSLLLISKISMIECIIKESSLIAHLLNIDTNKEIDLIIDFGKDNDNARAIQNININCECSSDSLVVNNIISCLI